MPVVEMTTTIDNEPVRKVGSMHGIDIFETKRGTDDECVMYFVKTKGNVVIGKMVVSADCSHGMGYINCVDIEEC